MAGIDRRSLILTAPAAALAFRRTQHAAAGDTDPDSEAPTLPEAKGKLNEPVTVNQDVVLLDAQVVGQYVIAELYNLAKNPIFLAAFVLTFYDADDNILGSTTAKPGPLVIGPNQIFPASAQFDAVLFEDDEWEYLDAVACEWSAFDGAEDEARLEESLTTNLSVSNISFITVYNGAQITGTVENNGTIDVLSTAVVMIRSEEGRLLSYWPEDIPREIPAGKSARFAYQLSGGNSLYGLPFSAIRDLDFTVDAMACPTFGVNLRAYGCGG